MRNIQTYIQLSVDDRRQVRTIVGHHHPEFNIHKCQLCWTDEERDWVEHHAKLWVRMGGEVYRPPRRIKFANWPRKEVIDLTVD